MGAYIVNRRISEFLRGMIADVNKGDNSINSATVTKLNSDLVKYQQEFQAVKQSQDKITTLKKLQATNSGLEQTALNTYYIYLSVIAILVMICVYFTIRTAWSSSLYQTVTSAVTTVK